MTLTTQMYLAGISLVGTLIYTYYIYKKIHKGD